MSGHSDLLRGKHFEPSIIAVTPTIWLVAKIYITHQLSGTLQIGAINIKLTAAV